VCFTYCTSAALLTDKLRSLNRQQLLQPVHCCNALRIAELTGLQSYNCDSAVPVRSLMQSAAFVAAWSPAKCNHNVATEVGHLVVETTIWDT